MNDRIRKQLMVLIISVIIAILVPIVFLLFQAIQKSFQQYEAKKDTIEVVASPMEEESQVQGVSEPLFVPLITPEPKTVEVELVMVGDMLLHGYVQTNGRQPDGSYNYDHFFQHVKKQIKKADVAVVNQEVIIGGEEFGIQNYPRFNCLNEAGDALVKAGFDVVLHATNHTLDQGVKGVQNCMEFWETEHPETTYLGVHKSEKARKKIYVYEKDGLRIAMLNYTYGLNGFSVPSDQSYLVDILDKEKVKKDIKKAKKQADFVVVYPHWGTEYYLGISQSQKDWAKFFADQGVDLVIGTHPHVVEPVEWINGKDGNSMLVYYSLGNFISAQDQAKTMLGAMAKVKIVKDTDGTVGIEDNQAIPIVTHWESGTATFTTYPLEKYSQELALRNHARNMDYSFSWQKMWDIWNEVIG